MSEAHPYKKLESIAHIVMGQSPSSTFVHDSLEQGLPFLQGCAEFGASTPTPFKSCSGIGKLAQQGASLISVRAPVGAINLANCDYIIGRGLAAISARSGVDAAYLRFALQWSAGSLYRVSQGSTFEAVGSKELKELLVPVPESIDEQYGIALMLSALDEQIEQTEALVAKLELARSGLYASLRDAHPPAIQIGEHFTLTSGMTPLRSTTHFYGSEGVPWVKTLDLNEGRLFETDEKVTARALTACSLRVMPAGTVLLAMYGGWIQIGRTALLETDACTNQAITALRPNCPADWNPYFLMKALQAWRHKWRDFAVSTRKDPNITKSDISQFMIPMPGIVEQTGWAENLETADELVNTHKAEAAKLRLQKQGLMRDLMTGKVRVAGGANA